MRLGTALALSAAAALAVGCGGSSNSGGGGGGTCNPTASTVIVVTGTGINPLAVCVLPAGTVTFQNNDTKTHQMVSTACAASFDTGVIAAGASGTANFPTAETCSFHDALAPTNAAYQGTVAVTSAPVGGPGY